MSSDDLRRQGKRPAQEVRLPVPPGTRQQVEAAIAKGRVTIPAGVFIDWKGNYDKRPVWPWKDRTVPVHPKERPRTCLWAHRTGAEFGIVVLDFDGDDGDVLLGRSGLKPHRRTGSGGHHVEVEPPDWPVKTCAGVLPGLDVRGDNGVAFFAGQSHKGVYQPLGDHPPYPLDQVPEWLRRPCGLWEPPPPPRPRAEPGTWEGGEASTEDALRLLGWWAAQIRDAPDGESNAIFHKAVYAMAGMAAAGMIDAALAEAELLAAGEVRDVEDIGAVFRSSWNAGFERPYAPDEDEYRVDDEEEPASSETGGDGTGAKKKRRRWQRLNDVVEETVTWLWARRLPRGKFTLLAGDPEAGKTFVAGAVTAALTSGLRLPDDGDGPPGGRTVVIFLTYEDGLGDTIRPRLRRCGADLEHVVVVDKGEVPITSRDVGEVTTLVRELRETGVVDVVLVIDPLMSFIGGKTDTATDNAVREALAPWIALADREALTILALIHLNKGDGKPLYRIMASIALVGLARVVLVAGPVPSRRDGHAGERMGLGILKSNLADKWGVIEYEIVDEDGPGTGALRWGVYRAALRGEDLISRPRGRPDDARDEAKDFLAKALADGPRPAKGLREEAEQEGITWATLRRAKKELGVLSYRLSVPGEWWWKKGYDIGDDDDGGDEES